MQIITDNSLFLKRLIKSGKGRIPIVLPVVPRWCSRRYSELRPTAVQVLGHRDVLAVPTYCQWMCHISLSTKRASGSGLSTSIGATGLSTRAPGIGATGYI